MKFQVKRSIDINAESSTVKDLILDFNHWNTWSPWTIAEPDCKITIKGKAGSVGHEMHWEGEIIGSGSNTLSAVEKNHLEYDLMFLTPYKSRSHVAFDFSPSGKTTTVTWTMDGSMPFFMFFMIPMMKGWISMDYDRGLRMLKALAEEGKVEAKTVNKGIVDIDGFSYVGIQRIVATDAVGDAMKKDFERIIDDVVKKHGKSAKHWMTIYPKMDMKHMTMTYIAAISDEELGDVDLGGDYVRGTVPSGKALEIHHHGRYDFLGNAWSMGMMYVRGKKLKQRGVPFEQYWNSPKETKPKDLKTSVYLPLK